MVLNVFGIKGSKKYEQKIKYSVLAGGRSLGAVVFPHAQCDGG